MRIVAGSARGRSLVAPASVTRPTSDRAREGIFSTLEHLLGTLYQKRVLDLYAGTGAMGLEAASRGASEVDLIESDSRATEVCRKNAANLGLVGVKVYPMTVEKWLTSVTPDAAYDLVVLDPPYETSNEIVVATLTDLLAHGWLVQDAVIAVERSAKSAAFDWPEGLKAVRERQYGPALVRYATKDC
jgi:16S rRNA (guanine966-N2)-methyltransferase